MARGPGPGPEAGTHLPPGGHRRAERVEVDCADAGRTVLAECWAHQGPPKSVQRHKVLADAFKLAWIATTLNPRPQLILCLSDPVQVTRALALFGQGPGQYLPHRVTLLRRLMAAGQAQAPPETRQALDVISQQVDDYIDRARLGKAA